MRRYNIERFTADTASKVLHEDLRITIQAVALSDCHETIWTEGAFRIDIECFALHRRSACVKFGG